jgi:hypothetical protein
MAQVIAFPTRKPRLRLVEAECMDFIDSQISGAAVALHQASGFVIDAGCAVRLGRTPGPDHAISNGEALESALQAVVHLAHMRSNPVDRLVYQAAINWFAANAGDTPDAN